MNLNITQLQYRALLCVRDHGQLMTFQVARYLKKDFWVVQDALKTLYRKGYLNNSNRLWSCPPPTEVTPAILLTSGCELTNNF